MDHEKPGRKSFTERKHAEQSKKDRLIIGGTAAALVAATGAAAGANYEVQHNAWEKEVARDNGESSAAFEKALDQRDLTISRAIDSAHPPKVGIRHRHEQEAPSSSEEVALPQVSEDTSSTGAFDEAKP